jgi:hypothetical protein
MQSAKLSVPRNTLLQYLPYGEEGDGAQYSFPGWQLDAAASTQLGSSLLYQPLPRGASGQLPRLRGQQQSVGVNNLVYLHH